MRIYVAHNYGRRRGLSAEELQANVDNSIRIGIELIKKGHIPIIPLLYHYVHLHANGLIPESVFIRIGEELVSASEAVLVATKPSDPESDIYKEIQIALKCEYPIFFSLEEVPDGIKDVKWCPQHGYPEPCAKCNGMTPEEWERFYKSLAESLGIKEKDAQVP